MKMKKNFNSSEVLPHQWRIVATSRELGYFAVVADDRVTGPAKEIADQSYVISTTDIESLALLVERRGSTEYFAGRASLI